MLEGLQAILEKEPVLSTVNAEDLQSDPLKVEGDYTRHVSTFVPMGEVPGLGERLQKRVISARTSKGMIVAPYGYGKTSTLAFLWHQLEQQKLVAVPPVYCASLLDILKATYGWVRFRLHGSEPGLVSDLHEVYDKYTGATIEEMARQYAQEHGLAPITAAKMLGDMRARGNLVLELTPANLLFFLDAVSGLVVRAGFKGLVIFADEFQQYFSKGANLRRTIQEFREFVWGLDTRSTPLGVIFSIPTYAEAVVQEQGKDILQRLKKDDLYYRLEDIYTVHFPEQLWRRYADTFRLGGISDQVMDSFTLNAIGQIAERDDLGEGPRTVIDSFKRAILHFQDHAKPYSPTDLIDDFLDSNIRFQAQANKLKIVTRQAIDSAIVDTDEKRQAVKLMAAFPRGCPVDVQKFYRLHEAVVTLSKRSHGDMMVRLAEGDTLVGLSRSGGPMHTVDRIVTRFWQGYEEDELHLDAAIRAFCNRLLPRSFSVRRGAAHTGWGNLDFATSAKGSQITMVEGTFNPKYPRRHLCLQVARSDNQLQPLNQAADLQIDFSFELRGSSEPGFLEIEQERLARFRFNLQQKVGEALPEDIRKLQEFVLPEFVTPLLMLSLVDFFDRWEDIEDEKIPDSDKAELEHYSGRLIGHAAQMLFSQSLAESVVPPLRRVRDQMIEELFNRFCVQLYPQYHTLFVQAQYETVINDYINAMLTMTLKERRGHATLTGTKEALARRFGVGSVATFDNRIENEYANLMKKGEWKGRGEQGVGEVVLQLHPLERAILDALRSSHDAKKLDGHVAPTMSANHAASLARDLGYRDEETLLALQLLAARGYSRFDRQDKAIYLVQFGPDLVELQTRLNQLDASVASISVDLLPAKQMEALQTGIEQVRNKMGEQADEEELDEVQTLLADLERQLSSVLSERRGELRGQLSSLTFDLDRMLARLRQADILDREIQGQVAFVMHLNELRQRLGGNRKRLADEAGVLRQTISRAGDLDGDGPISEAIALRGSLEDARRKIEDIERRWEILQSQTSNLEKWIRLLRDCDQLFNALVHLPELREKLTREVVPEIQSHLTKRRLDGLADWEPFDSKVKDVEAELEARRRHGNEEFVKTKEGYEDFLRDIGVAEHRPRARYTYGEDEDSYRDLYGEVLAKIDGYLNEIALELKRNQTDLLKAQHIHLVGPEQQTVLKEVSSLLAQADGNLVQLRRSLTVPLIQRAGEEMTDFGKRVVEVANVSDVARKRLGPVLYGDHQLSTDESRVLEAFSSRADIDLTDLFVTLRLAGQISDLGALLHEIENLYRKNRVIVRIRLRG